jgi:hypothetical protein
VTDRRSRSWAVLGLGLLVGVGFTAPAPAQTGMSPAAPTAEHLRGKAEAFERAGKWDEALQVWLKVYGQDRTDSEAHKHVQVCLRRIFQAQRQTDKSLREKVLSLTHTQALALYGEVLTTLHGAYVDKAKVTPNELFQQGLDEFLVSLNDAKFRKLHLPEARDAAVREFQNRVREYMSARGAIETVPDAVALVKSLAATAKRDLHLARTSAIVLEFIGGACNSLDEYTTYLSPAEVAAEGRVASEASVVDAGYLKDGVGYFRITHFRDTTPDEVDAAVNALRMSPQGMQGLRALVMDLRGNPGGLFPAAVQVVERFLPQGVIVTTQGRVEGANKVHAAGPRMNVIDLPLVVLVDGTTASAAEVLAAAFRDHQRATLVGTATYGKGSIQHVLQFQTAEENGEDGKPRPRTGGVRITLARFFSPNGQAVSGAGITPHIVEPDRTRQLQTAEEQALRYVSVMPMMSPPAPPMLR